MNPAHHDAAAGEGIDVSSETSHAQATHGAQETVPELIPDLVEARRFLALLAPGEDVTFQTFSDKKGLMKQWRDPKSDKVKEYDPNAQVFHGRLDDFAERLATLNALGVGIFVMVNAGDGQVHEGSKTCRTNANVVHVRAHILDLDGAPLEPVLATGVQPHIVVESSPGRFHVYWRVDDCPRNEFSRRQDALNRKFGADESVKDLARVLRLPGFFNHKYETPPLVRMIDDVRPTVQ